MSEITVQCYLNLVCNLCGRRLDFSKRGAGTVNVDPCPDCLDEAEWKLYDEGYEDGYQAGFPDGGGV